MVAVTFTQTDAVIGTLTNGRKVVSTIVTVSNTGTQISQITIKPLTRITNFIAGSKTITTGGIITWSTGTGNNTIGITPAASANTDVFQIISIGV